MEEFIKMFFAEYLIYIIGVVLVILFFIKKNRLMVISSIITVFLSRIVITEPLKRILNITRPNGEPFSFPSGHSAIVFAIAMAVFYFNKKWGIIAFVLAILVGIGRVWIGVHRPIDILAGALIGILSGIIVNKFVIKKNS
ncbi:MAG TPA: phosphatase PAP2 family protein [Candidatus Portnoybacteria bacterium]|jgi:undecaprenyl-diphosphatase|nr:phosphatase PAP2 family protein [Candidatus Portnoybacteria bacterium]MDD5752232.1 phosphatase PAP2 family protein [Candidatus Portnoybacteria bacterium]HNU96830.1 phosphatase PAP2 family protein [Candidatus Portnoybacteria bacterium]HOZ16496.1 phosphatase PAP2 family protein [Candidatus Portnoybacteria bacterium]HPH52256.1 phosphatase PAP2 family protein [Candidatus Portnoybacteria bacterium]